VILELQPLVKSCVEFVQTADPLRIDGREKLLADGTEEPFDFSPPLGFAGTGVYEDDSEDSEEPLRLIGNEGGAIVGVESSDAAVRTQDVLDSRFEGCRLLAKGEGCVDAPPGSVVDEREENGLRLPTACVGDRERVHGVGLHAFERGEELELAGGELRRTLNTVLTIHTRRANETRE
jgi:hypothetical protein